MKHPDPPRQHSELSLCSRAELERDLLEHREALQAHQLVIHLLRAESDYLHAALDDAHKALDDARQENALALR